MSDPAAPDVTATLPGGGGNLYSVSLASDGSRVMAGGAGADVRTWWTDPAAAADWACSATGTPMSAAEWEQVAPGVSYTPPCPTPEGA
jgi:hypothetical protein